MYRKESVIKEAKISADIWSQPAVFQHCKPAVVHEVMHAPHGVHLLSPAGLLFIHGLPLRPQYLIFMVLVLEEGLPLCACAVWREHPQQELPCHLPEACLNAAAEDTLFEGFPAHQTAWRHKATALTWQDSALCLLMPVLLLWVHIRVQHSHRSVHEEVTISSTCKANGFEA